MVAEERIVGRGGLIRHLGSLGFIVVPVDDGPDLQLTCQESTDLGPLYIRWLAGPGLVHLIQPLDLRVDQAHLLTFATHILVLNASLPLQGFNMDHTGLVFFRVTQLLDLDSLHSTVFRDLLTTCIETARAFRPDLAAAAIGQHLGQRLDEPRAWWTELS